MVHAWCGNGSYIQNCISLSFWRDLRCCLSPTCVIHDEFLFLHNKGSSASHRPAYCSPHSSCCWILISVCTSCSCLASAMLATLQFFGIVPALGTSFKKENALLLLKAYELYTRFVLRCGVDHSLVPAPPPFSQ